MSTATNLTAVLANLLTDKSLRTAFAQDPRHFAETTRLPPEDRAILLALNTRQLERQAHALVRKRLYEVKKLLPQTALALDASFAALFLDYAEKHWPDRVDCYHDRDAVAFCAALPRPHQQAVDRRELQTLRLALDPPKFKIRISREQRANRLCRCIHLLYRTARHGQQELKISLWI